VLPVQALLLPHLHAPVELQLSATGNAEPVLQSLQLAPPVPQCAASREPVVRQKPPEQQPLPQVVLSHWQVAVAGSAPTHLVPVGHAPPVAPQTHWPVTESHRLAVLTSQAKQPWPGRPQVGKRLLRRQAPLAQQPLLHETASQTQPAIVHSWLLVSHLVPPWQVHAPAVQASPERPHERHCPPPRPHSATLSGCGDGVGDGNGAPGVGRKHWPLSQQPAPQRDAQPSHTPFAVLQISSPTQAVQVACDGVLPQAELPTPAACTQSTPFGWQQPLQVAVSHLHAGDAPEVSHFWPAVQVRLQEPPGLPQLVGEIAKQVPPLSQKLPVQTQLTPLHSWPLAQAGPPLHLQVPLAASHEPDGRPPVVHGAQVLPFLPQLLSSTAVTQLLPLQQPAQPEVPSQTQVPPPPLSQRWPAAHGWPSAPHEQLPPEQVLALVASQAGAQIAPPVTQPTAGVPPGVVHMPASVQQPVAQVCAHCATSVSVLIRSTTVRSRLVMSGDGDGARSFSPTAIAPSAPRSPRLPESRPAKS
jgi:hypothetical protein